MCWKGSIATLLLLLFPTYCQEHLCSSWEECLARKHRTFWIHFRYVWYVQIAKPPPSCLFRSLLNGRSKVQNAVKQMTRPTLGCWVDLNTKGQRHMKLFLGPHRCFLLKWTWTRLSSLWSFSGWFFPLILMLRNHSVCCASVEDSQIFSGEEHSDAQCPSTVAGHL